MASAACARTRSSVTTSGTPSAGASSGVRSTSGAGSSAAGAAGSMCCVTRTTYLPLGRGQRRCPGRAMTPSGSGGSPAMVQSRSDHATRWSPRSPPSGVHEARTSISTLAGRSDRPAKLSRPRGSRCPPRRCTAGGGCRARRSARTSRPRRASGRWPPRAELGPREGHRAPHAVPGLGGAGVVQQHEPPRGELLAVTRGAHDLGGEGHGIGAMRWGAGTSTSRTSGRSRAPRSSLSACVNSGDGSPVTDLLPTTTGYAGALSRGGPGRSCRRLAPTPIGAAPLGLLRVAGAVKAGGT